MLGKRIKFHRIIDAIHLLRDKVQTCNIVKKESGSLILDEKPLGCHKCT